MKRCKIVFGIISLLFVSLACLLTEVGQQQDAAYRATLEAEWQASEATRNAMLALTQTPTPTPTPTPTASPTPETVELDFNILAEEDTYVMYSQLLTSFGSEQTLVVWGKGNDFGYVFLRFPLTGIPAGTPISSAQLRLQIHPDSMAQREEAWVLIADGSWTEANLNANNMPVFNKGEGIPEAKNLPLSGYTGDGSEDVLDITTIVQYAIGQGQPYLNLVLGLHSSGGSRQVWYSRESGNKGPVLEVTGTTP